MVAGSGKGGSFDKSVKKSKKKWFELNTVFVLLLLAWVVLVVVLVLLGVVLVIVGVVACHYFYYH